MRKLILALLMTTMVASGVFLFVSNALPHGRPSLATSSQGQGRDVAHVASSQPDPANAAAPIEAVPVEPVTAPPPEPIEQAPPPFDMNYLYTPSNDGTADVVRDVLDRMNRERTARGLNVLTSDPGLSAAAQEWAQAMTTQGYVHSSRDRLTNIMHNGSFAAVGENIHAPERQCAAAVGCDHLDAQPTSGVLNVDWMRSRSHRDNLTDPRWSKVGIGVTCTADGRMWAATLFAAPHTDTPVPSAQQGSSPEPLVEGLNDGYTCSGQRREHNPRWVHPQ